MEPRQHHIQMKYMLAQLAIQNPERFFATFKPGGDATYLPKLWVALGRQLPSEKQISSEGLTVWHQSKAETPEIIVIILPLPMANNEAYFVGAVRSAGVGCRVFCLERATMPSTGENYTVLSELAAGGRSNWGAGCSPVVEEFAALICRVIADPSARPNAFVPMRLA